MKEIVITFDADDVEFYTNGPKYFSVISELSQRLRSRMKYEEEGPGNDYETVEAIRDELFDIWHEEMTEELL